MPVDILNSKAIFMALRENWNQLYALDPESQHVLSWQSLRELYDACDDSDTIYILAYRTDEAHMSEIPYRAFLPLVKTVRINESQVSFEIIVRMAGHYSADYMGLLCDPTVEHEAIDTLSRALASLNWTCLQLDPLKTAEYRKHALTKHLEKPDFDVRTSHYNATHPDTAMPKPLGVHLPHTYSDYLERYVSPNVRQQLRCLEQQFEQDETLAIRESTDVNLDRDLKYFKQLWTQRWAYEKGSNATALAERHANTIRQGLKNQSMQLYVMTKNAKPIGFNAHYIDHQQKSALFFMGVRDASIKNMSTGLLLQATIIRRSIEQGLRYYDFLGGDESYKHVFGGHNQKICSLHIHRNEHAPLLTEDLQGAFIALRRFQRLADPSDVATLYKLLHASHPNERRVLRHFEKWSMSRSSAKENPDFFPTNASW